MSKFKVWIDSPIVGTNIQSAGTFESDSQRTSGFIAGTSSSAIRVNTALRQANLVTVALMNLVNDNNLSVESNVSNVQSALNTYFSGLNVAAASDAANVTTNINGKAISTIFESDGTTVKNATSSASATNVTTNINGKSISNIFESNGTTVKKATNSDTTKLYLHNMYVRFKDEDDYIYVYFQLFSYRNTSITTFSDLINYIKNYTDNSNRSFSVTGYIDKTQYSGAKIGNVFKLEYEIEDNEEYFKIYYLKYSNNDLKVETYSIYDDGATTHIYDVCTLIF